MRMVIALVVALGSCGGPVLETPYYKLDQPLTFAQLEGTWLRGREQLELRADGTFTRSFKAVEGNASRNDSPACTVTGTFILSSPEQKLTLKTTTSCGGGPLSRDDQSRLPDEIRIMKIDAESFHVNDSDRTSFWRPSAVAARETPEVVERATWTQEDMDQIWRDSIAAAERDTAEREAAAERDAPAKSTPTSTSSTSSSPPTRTAERRLSAEECDGIISYVCDQITIDARRRGVGDEHDVMQFRNECPRNQQALRDFCPTVTCGERWKRCMSYESASEVEFNACKRFAHSC